MPYEATKFEVRHVGDQHACFPYSRDPTSLLLRVGAVPRHESREGLRRFLAKAAQKKQTGFAGLAREEDRGLTVLFSAASAAFLCKYNMHVRIGTQKRARKSRLVANIHERKRKRVCLYTLEI